MMAAVSAVDAAVTRRPRSSSVALHSAIAPRAASKSPSIARRPASARRTEAAIRGCSAARARISSQRRIPSSTGVGPNHTAPTSMLRLCASVRLSPARRA